MMNFHFRRQITQQCLPGTLFTFRKLATQYGVEVLASLPLSMEIREQADNGKPTAVADPNSPIALIYQELARQVGARIVLQEAASQAMPTITTSDD